MDSAQTGSEFFDYETPPSMFANIEKDDNDQFPLKVSKKEKLNHDTFYISLEFPNKEWIAGLWVGGHYVFHADIDGKHVSKKYTPISPINQKGSSDFAIKVYRPNEEFPDGGVYTKWMENNVNVGDTIMCEGPIGMIKYLGFGKVILKKKELKPKSKIFLCAGGSGITPFFSVAQASVLAKDGVQVTLIYSNKTKDDILIEKEISELAQLGENFKVFHTLTRHDEAKHGAWDGLQGRIDINMLKQCGLPEPSDDLFVGCCGPKGFGDSILAPFAELGYEKGEMFP